MKIITKAIEEAFKKQGYTGDKSAKDIKIVMKLFYPAGAGTWYLYERLMKMFICAMPIWATQCSQNVELFQCPNSWHSGAGLV